MSQLGEIRVRAANAEDFDKIVTIIRKLASSDGRSDQVQVTPERLAKDNGLQNDPQLFACAVAERRAIDSNQFELIGYVTFYYGFTSWEGLSLVKNFQLKTVIVKSSLVNENY